MKVFVVMGNDFPDAVFTSEEAADKYCKREKQENVRIHWRLYEFELRDE